MTNTPDDKPDLFVDANKMVEMLNSPALLEKVRNQLIRCIPAGFVMEMDLLHCDWKEKAAKSIVEVIKEELCDKSKQ